MATYYGGVHTREDAILLLEACQLDILPKISRRLSRKERKILIEPGAVFIWDEAEAGIQRWTDGRLWGSITVSDSFIIRREMERKVRRTSMVDEKDGGVVDMEIDRRGSDENQIDGGLIDGYRYKANGLVRRSLIISASGRQLHLVTYHDSSYGYSPELRTPTSDQPLRQSIEEKITARIAVDFPGNRENLRCTTERLWGRSNTGLSPSMVVHSHDALPPSQQPHLSTDPIHLHEIFHGSPQARNDDFTNLCMLLISLSQNSLNVPPYELYHPCSRSQIPAASAYQLLFGVRLQDNYQPKICSLPTPQISPNPLVTPPQQHPVAIAAIPPAIFNNTSMDSYQHIPPDNIGSSSTTIRPFKSNLQYPSFPSCSSLSIPPMKREAMIAHHIDPVEEFGERNRKDRRNLERGGSKVNRDDENMVRSLDKRFLVD